MFLPFGCFFLCQGEHMTRDLRSRCAYVYAVADKNDHAIELKLDFIIIIIFSISLLL